jgi:hypothetical protein
MSYEDHKDKVKRVTDTNPEIMRLASAKELISGVIDYPGSLSVISLDESKLIAYYAALRDMAKATQKRVDGDEDVPPFVGINSFLLNLQMCRPSVEGVRAEQFKDAIMPRPATPLELASATSEDKIGFFSKIANFLLGKKKEER